jgi:hypothetical protein
MEYAQTWVLRNIPRNTRLEAETIRALTRDSMAGVVAVAIHMRLVDVLRIMRTAEVAEIEQDAS